MYWPAAGGDITTDEPRQYDMRGSDRYAPDGLERVNTTIRDARAATDVGIFTSGFDLFDHPSQVKDFSEHSAIMSVYYEECRTLARALTGAECAFTYDHLIREPDRQVSGGGTDGQTRITGGAQGGGYVGSVHMDYTTHTTWEDYLAVHGEHPPSNPKRVLVLNFWRGVSEVVDDYPLAVCDARTVRAEDLFETVVFGYGADNYSWHDLGIETYNVKASSRQHWYYYPRMCASELLVFKTFDSEGVIGRACPHAAFTNPLACADAPPRRSIELRVLCYVL
ncbi:MAG: hypothetical protein GXP16_03690 [Gammaproteobacteria bacterium]|nr:hypothetical protein [Gammaproteobacteria bacterium]